MLFGYKRKGHSWAKNHIHFFISWAFFYPFLSSLFFLLPLLPFSSLPPSPTAETLISFLLRIDHHHLLQLSVLSSPTSSSLPSIISSPLTIITFISRSAPSHVLLLCCCLCFDSLLNSLQHHLTIISVLLYSHHWFSWQLPLPLGIISPLFLLNRHHHCISSVSELSSTFVIILLDWSIQAASSLHRLSTAPPFLLIFSIVDQHHHSFSAINDKFTFPLSLSETPFLLARSTATPPS